MGGSFFRSFHLGLVSVTYRCGDRILIVRNYPNVIGA